MFFSFVFHTQITFSCWYHRWTTKQLDLNNLDVFKFGSPVCVMMLTSSRLMTLHVGPVSSTHDTRVQLHTSLSLWAETSRLRTTALCYPPQVKLTSAFSAPTQVKLVGESLEDFVDGVEQKRLPTVGRSCQHQISIFPSSFLKQFLNTCSEHYIRNVVVLQELLRALLPFIFPSAFTLSSSSIT